MFRGINRNIKLFMISGFTFAFSYHLWLNLSQLFLADLGAAPSQIGSALASASLFGCLLSLPAGWLTDRIGPKKVIIGSQLLSISGLMIMALSRTWQGAAAGLVASNLWVISNPALIVYVLSNNVGQTDRSEGMLGLAFSPWWSAAVFAPGLGGLVAEHFSIRVDLWIGVVGLLVSALAMILAEDTRYEALKAVRPFDQLIHNRAFIKTLICLSAVYAVLFVGNTLAPNFLRDIRGFSPALIGGLYSVAAIGTLLINMLIARASSPRQGFTLLMIIAWLGYAGLLFFSNPTMLGMAFLFIGSLESSWVVINAIIVRFVDQSTQGVAIGIIETLRYLAIAVASWAAGFTYGLTPGHQLPIVFGLAGIPLMLGISLLVVFSARKRVVSV